MPAINLKHISSVSSEDIKYPAQNLVGSTDFKTWKSGKSGEKQVSVVIQFEKAEKIHQIDIGNNHSAFVEVLVGKSTAKDDDFQVLLVASSFMSPAESRSGSNATRVRIFSREKLSKEVSDKNWDSVKIVCTQPFTKSVQYGLSFVKLHSPPEEGATSQPAKTMMKLGAFRMKDDSEEDIKAGSLFAKKDTPQPAPLTGAAAVRAAARLADKSRPTVTSSPRTPTPSGNKRKHSAEDNDVIPSIDVTIKTPLRKQSTSLSSVTSRASTATTPPLKRTKTEPPKKSSEKEFSNLMNKVAFVMSGYENPERAKIRDKATEMGADYKPNWSKGCTHLICAFENTPKYQQVKGKGRIVDAAWILDSYKKKQMLPWRKYRVGKARTPPGSSDESEDEYTPSKRKRTPPPQRKKSKHDSSTEDDSEEEGYRPSKKKQDPVPKRTNTSKHESTKGKSLRKKSHAAYEESTDGGTDDEIERLKAAKVKTATKDTKSVERDSDAIYDMSTDEEMTSKPVERSTNAATNSEQKFVEIEELPDLFSNKHFLLYGVFSPADRRTLTRYVTAYDGILEEYMGLKVNYVITKSTWDEDFDSALSDNASLAFVKPEWIHACHDQQKYIPHQRYVVIPQ